jgi:protein SCO1/2
VRYLTLIIYGSLLILFPGHAFGAESKSVVTEHLGTTLEGQLELTDHEGITATLASMIRSDRPTILNFVYYRCPGACTLLLNGLSAAVMETQFLLGSDYDVITVTVDPMETTDLAAGKRTTYLEPLAKPGINKAHWRFYTGAKETLRRLTSQAGFGYEYDADTLQYIHPSVLIFLGPDRSVMRYLYGSYFQPDNFEHALVESGDGTVGTVRQQLITALHDFGRPETGRRYALNKARVTGVVVSIIALGLCLVLLGLRSDGDL